MSLLVEYSLADGKASDPIDALNKLVARLKSIADGGYDYTETIRNLKPMI